VALQRIIINIGGGKVRDEVLEGRKHLVVNAVILKEAVLEGSEGAIFYPEEEISAEPASWDGQPIVVYHPEDEDGKPTTAKRKEVFNASKIGVLLETEYDEKLRTECWFDEQRTKEVDVRIYNAIKKKKKVEVSTGLDATLVDKEGEFGGAKYKLVATKIKPDHLAILPDKIGALSVAMGGGLFANALNKEAEGFATVAMRSLQESVKGIGITFVDNEISFSDTSHQLSDLLSREHGEPGKYWQGWISDVFPDYVVFWNDGKMWRQNYTVTDDVVALSGKAVEARRVISYVTNSKPEEGSMAFEKKKFVDRLITNGVAPESDREKLMAADDKVLSIFETELDAREAEAKKKPAPIVEEEKPKIENKKKEPEEELTEDELVKRLPKRLRRVLNRAEQKEKEEKERFVKIILNNKTNRFKKEYLEGLDPEVLEGMAQLAGPSKKAEEEDDEDSPLVKRKNNYIGNAGGIFEEPPEEKEDDEDILVPLGEPKFGDPRKRTDRDDD
jgi:hypothetical protein